jgi:hypothetical protein
MTVNRRMLGAIMIPCFKLVANLDLSGQEIEREFTVENQGQTVLVRVQGGPCAIDGSNILLIPGHEFTHIVHATPSPGRLVGGSGKGLGVEHTYPPKVIDLEELEKTMVSFETDQAGEEAAIVIEISFQVVEARVVPPPEVQDGLPSEAFVVMIDPPGIQGQDWQWQWEPLDEGAARLPPDPYFSDPAAKNPVVPTAFWHSEAGSTLIKGEQGDLLNGADPDQARHRVRCTVTLGNGDEITTPWEEWNVFVFKETPGVDPPDVGGTLPYSRISTEEAPGADGFVASIPENTAEDNPFTRTDPVVEVKGMVEQNSFFEKVIVVHEGEHMKQWTEADTEWFPLYQAGTFWDTIRDLSETGSNKDLAEIRLRTSIRNEANKQYAAWEGERLNTWWKRELEAHTLSNEVAPLFLNSKLDYWEEGVEHPGENRPKPATWPLSQD